MTTINGIVLLSCPFCGSNLCISGREFIMHYGHYLICMSCHTSGPRHETLEDAIEAWNKRTTPPSMTVTTSLREEE